MSRVVRALGSVPWEWCCLFVCLKKTLRAGGTTTVVWRPTQEHSFGEFVLPPHVHHLPPCMSRTVALIKLLSAKYFLHSWLSLLRNENNQMKPSGGDSDW